MALKQLVISLRSSSIKSSTQVDPVRLNDCTPKILGLNWITQEDVLTFSISLPSAQPIITKRVMLLEIAQIFDPLGFISPVVIKAKILLQQLWLLKSSWDEPVPNSILLEWLHIREDLLKLQHLSVPRWLGILTESTVEIHGFSDASQLALTAVIYLKVDSMTTGPLISLLGAKTKVSPLKPLTIPRLDLTAAHLLAKLTNHFVATLQVKIASIHLWTDSSTTLAWIKSHPSRWKEFVKNRVAAIQELTPTAHWKHVPGSHNPADCASRGLLTSELIQHQLWWQEPSCLKQEPCHWPVQRQDYQVDSLPEAKQQIISLSSSIKEPWDLLHKYSSLQRLIQITALCIKACNIFRHKTQNYSSHLTAELLSKAKLYWIKSVQHYYFSSEFTQLQNSQVPTNHVFNKLTVFIDSKDILRIGGRLSNALISENQIHSAVLPIHGKFTQLIISHSHKSTVRGGTQLTLAHTRQEFWIIGGRVPISSYIIKCVICARHRAKRACQLMGQLPIARVTPSRPFTHTGIDYAGPVSVKTWKGRGSKVYKGWICVFVCFSTSAVHIEAVTDYSTDGFLAAYKRFTSRRGTPSRIYSEYGTNFIGAEKVLKTLLTQAQFENSSIHTHVINQGTQWIFNSPAAPHMGGKWEAAVKSTKFHLTRSIGDTLLSLEELITVLTQIECMLNSRALQPLTEDPDDIFRCINTRTFSYWDCP